MQTKGIILQASSRSKGNTSKIVSLLQEKTGYDVVDLAKLNIAHFDYEFNNQEDDFPSLIKKIASTYDTVILATPVYWYSMSGLLKVFLDRISDCLIIDKETGRKLRGKSLGLLICGSEAEETPGFENPIKSTANYLGMQYLGYVHSWISSEGIPEQVQKDLKLYAEKLTKTTVTS